MSAFGLRIASASKARPVRLASCSWSQASRLRSFPARHIHTRLPLPYNVEDGMGEFLTPEGLKLIAVDYQQGLLDRLNDAVKGTGEKNKSVAQIVIDTAPDASRTLAFNYASLALNNSYFLSCLKPSTPELPHHEHEISKDLEDGIRKAFGDLNNFKSVVSAAANGMVSTGWVWFVGDEKGNIGVVATYGAGTLLTAKRNHKGRPEGSQYGSVYSPVEPSDPAAGPNPSAPLSSATPSSPASGLSRQSPPIHPSSPARTLHTSAVTSEGRAVPRSLYKPGNRMQNGGPALANDPADSSEMNFDKLGDVLFPLFCLSVQEHAWLGSGYGVWGKEEYLKRFWTCLDWQRISTNYARLPRTGLDE
ncbi:hypothetical protein DENSPDRAFT_862199 [Dentipellis sp. KUC8613]|nr:hypothetical protein DENSPDRAFT_862199 [Dentipellis sp. KUC8613]